MTKRRTKSRSSHTRATTRPRSFDKLRTPSGNGRALVISDLVRFVGLAPSKESLVGALREAGLA